MNSAVSLARLVRWRRKWPTAGLIALLVALSGLLTCEAVGQDMTLASGRKIRILSIGKMHFSQGPTALMLKYQTATPIDDLPALQAEADEIWERFRFDVEKAQLTVGLLNANEPPKGFIISTSRAFTFVFKKSSDGRWSKMK